MVQLLQKHSVNISEMLRALRFDLSIQAHLPDLALRFATKLEDDDVVVPRNQALIIKTVMTYRSSIVEVAHISETDDAKVVETRRRLLQSTDV